MHKICKVHILNFRFQTYRMAFNFSSLVVIKNREVIFGKKNIKLLQLPSPKLIIFL